MQAAGRKVALVKSSIDTRYHSSRIVTHDGHSKVTSTAGPETVLAICIANCIASGTLRGMSDVVPMLSLITCCSSKLQHDGDRLSFWLVLSMKFKESRHAMQQPAQRC